jgi:hypothetical protein
MVSFLNEGDRFMSYSQPSSFIEDQAFSDDTFTKEEAIKRHALMSAINEDEQVTMPPFKHTVKD